MTAISLKHSGEMGHLRDGFKYLLNPGSVGQPRDSDLAPRISSHRSPVRGTVQLGVDRTDAGEDRAGPPEVLAHDWGGTVRAGGGTGGTAGWESSHPQPHRLRPPCPGCPFLSPPQLAASHRVRRAIPGSADDHADEKDRRMKMK